MPLRPLLLVGVLVAAVGAFAPAHAQLTLTHADVEAHLEASSHLTTYSVDLSGASLAQVQALADRSGANQTWDFRTLDTFSSAFSYDLYPASLPVPGSERKPFATATHAARYTERVPTDYVSHTLYCLSPSAFETLGLLHPARIDEVDSTLALYYTPPRLTYPLPLTAESRWTTRWSFILGTPTPGFTSETTETAEVEGWGTLVLPSGSAPALKVRAKTVTTATSYVGGNATVSRDSSYTLTFYTASGAGASLLLNRTGTVSDASYTTVHSPTGVERPGAGTAFALDVAGPQPARGGTLVPLRIAVDAATQARLDVFDVQGRRVAALADRVFGAGTHDVTWPTDSLAPGVYVVRLATPTQALTRLLVLVR